MPRETIEIVLPSGLKVVAYTYLTAAESIEFNAVYQKAMRIDMSTIKDIDSKDPNAKVPMKGEIDGTVLIEQDRLLVKYLVKEPIEGVDGVYNLRESDYIFLTEKLKALRAANLAQAK